jgi:hypothetical protein
MIETAVGLCVGIGLAAACGLRVFLPLLALSLAAKTGLVSPGEGFAWIASWPAVTGLAIATALEVGAYFVPWIDHALDSVASPAALVAGTLVAASRMGSMDPALSWACAVIAGGGVAGLVQTATVAVRGASTAVTAGTANPVISAMQSAAAAVLSVLAVVVPVVAVLVLIVMAVVVARLVIRWRSRRRLAMA